MPLYILDTDSVSHLQRNHPVISSQVATLPNDAVTGITIITVIEQYDGWQAELRRARTNEKRAACYTRFTDTVRYFRSQRVFPMSAAALERFDALVKLKLNVGSNDLRIAAVAPTLNATVVTANVRDFARVPGLLVEDWTQPA